jgi:hypothetical protein
MAVRCGRCQCYHETSNDVFRCFNGGKVAVLDAPSAASVRKAGGPSDKQRKFINSMRQQLGMVEFPDDYLDQLDFSATRRTIDDLLAQVDNAKQEGTLKPRPGSIARHLRAEDYPAVTTGYYAVQNLMGGNDLSFFSVNIPEQGQWEGFLFVKRIVGGHEPERVSRATAEAWLKRIDTDERVQASKRLYGQQIGSCGECGRTLTDEVSRAYGIGPVCRERGGY